MQHSYCDKKQKEIKSSLSYLDSVLLSCYDAIHYVAAEVSAGTLMSVDSNCTQ